MSGFFVSSAEPSASATTVLVQKMKYCNNINCAFKQTNSALNNEVTLKNTALLLITQWTQVLGAGTNGMSVSM
jgi:hypothetical protein